MQTQNRPPSLLSIHTVLQGIESAHTSRQAVPPVVTAGCGSGGCCSPRGGGGDQCCQIGQHYFPTISSHSRIYARLVLGALFLEDLWGFFYTLSRFPSLAPPAKVLQLNLNSPSVLRLGLRYVSRFSPSKCCASDQREEGVAESYDVKVSSR